MNATNGDAGYPSGLAARLKLEARSTRPGFSDAFHARLMERVAREQVLFPARDAGVWESRSTFLRRFTMPIAAAAAFAAVLTVLVTGSGPAVTSSGLVSMERTGQPSLDDRPSLGIESLPLYDDIDAGVRAGAWMLASSLVEMPDWATLADFDADAVPRDPEGP